MAYDRYDTRGNRNQSREDRGNDRGFFERAGDEVASWFGDEDAERRRRDDERRNQASSDRDYDRSRDFRGSNRDRSRDDNRGFFPEHGYLRSEYEPGYVERSDNRRDRSSSRPMNWTSSDRDYESASSRGYGRGAPGLDYGSKDFGRMRYSTGGEGGRQAYESRSDRGADRRDDYRDTSYAGSGNIHDRHYHAWRQRQINELDNDYDQYRRENQQKFESDFGNWRQTRQGQRQHLGSIREHMDVVGSDGETIGKVDKVHGAHIVLTKSDSADHHHHAIDCSMIDTIEGDQVRLNTTAEEATKRLRDHEDRGAIGNHDWSKGHNLERSFSGTYER
jgi:hypothetical protein